MTDTFGDPDIVSGKIAVDLRIEPEIYDIMIRHAQADAPLECCGLLAGRAGQAWRIYPLANASRSETRYDADPKALIEAVQAIRRESTEIVAIYHSHPKWPAVPSRTDLSENHYGEVPRIIVGLLTDPPECRIWRLYREENRFEELTWSLSTGLEPDEIAGNRVSQGSDSLERR